jgi:hypothetical protein
MIVLCPEFHNPDKIKNLMPPPVKTQTKKGKKEPNPYDNQPLKPIALPESLESSKMMTKPNKEKINKNGDAWTYDKKSGEIELRSHQIRLLGYTDGEFDTVSYDKKNDKYSIKPLNYRIAIYEIAVA